MVQVYEDNNGNPVPTCSGGTTSGKNGIIVSLGTSVFEVYTQLTVSVVSQFGALNSGSLQFCSGAVNFLTLYKRVPLPKYFNQSGLLLLGTQEDVGYCCLIGVADGGWLYYGAPPNAYSSLTFVLRRYSFLHLQRG